METLLQVGSHEAAEYVYFLTDGQKFFVKFDDGLEEFNTFEDARKDVRSFLCDCGVCGDNYYIRLLNELKEPVPAKIVAVHLTEDEWDRVTTYGYDNHDDPVLKKLEDQINKGGK